MYILLGGYLRILGAPSVQSCCTLSMSASYRAFVCGKISQIQTCLRVIVGPGLVSTSPAWPACPQNGKSGHIAGGRRGRYCLHNDFTDHCDSYIAVADILTSYYLFLFLRHSVNQCVSRFYGTIVEEAA